MTPTGLQSSLLILTATIISFIFYIAEVVEERAAVAVTYLDISVTPNSDSSKKMPWVETLSCKF